MSIISAISFMAFTFADSRYRWLKYGFSITLTPPFVAAGRRRIRDPGRRSQRRRRNPKPRAAPGRRAVPSLHRARPDPGTEREHRRRAAARTRPLARRAAGPCRPRAVRGQGRGTRTVRVLRAAPGRPPPPARAAGAGAARRARARPRSAGAP